MNERPLFAIGDIQGCLDELLLLLKKIPSDASLLFLGDLVNRGPQSLETLRFIKSLGHRARTVLGNHDLHLLALEAHQLPPHKKDTLQAIFQAPDKDELLTWLRHQPLMIESHQVVFVHAGLHPLWDLNLARQLNQEATQALRSDQWKQWLQGMYGNTQWHPTLTGPDRMRAILNGFTRIRYVHEKTLELDFNEKLSEVPTQSDLVPWFKVPHRVNQQLCICFGHWSTLGLQNTPHIIALDTGCLWGNCLTAMSFPDRTIVSVDSLQPRKF